MTKLTFPLVMTWDELAALPKATEIFSWDDSRIDDDTPNLAAAINSDSNQVNSKLAGYLSMIGYTVGDEGVSIRSETAIRTAHALFNQIIHEYDEVDCPRVERTIYGYTGETTPTWAMFDLSGDDDVDYNGGLPSQLTELLLEYC